MNTRVLQSFIKVYEKKSVAAAARELYISPQGLSKIIKQLEYDLETDLFYRGVQGMEATEAGELLYARARHICYLLDDIKKEISIIGGNLGTLNIVVTYSTSASISIEYLLQFSEIHPNIRIKINEYPDEYPVDSLFQDEADIGIVLGHDDIPDCSSELLVSGRTVVAVADTHPLSGRDEISLKELAGYDLVAKTPVPGRENSLLAAYEKLGISPKLMYSTGNFNAMRRSCITEMQVVESIDFVEHAFPDSRIKVLRIKENIPQNIYLVSREREIQNRAVKLFQTYVRGKDRK